ncbi:hypothetical protein DSM43518_05187 [Mycobacterium marinum]|uniref:Uncharacterized protein n=2 Tax=Mycobacterium ulcerans group TaxID=2993898 RepID=A0A3E2MQL3_MYCMR|nr:hypothetical protein MULP_02972 [Mycobacterium liflandii 128FXT]AXN44131.1 hypothetical protein MM1218R_02192 [Mycobacterium marinum]BEH76367.1 hypothetical protein YM3MPS_21700 [Mycobacterium pseudoshottsii]AXN49501.1 hypothetical protein CCUG20998_02093 [Mycobacterium marinum]RFZ02369.1 hypothetical protein DSM43518_05187 [Mycobacterium marinum]
MPGYPHGGPRIVAAGAQCYGVGQSTSFNDPSGEAEKEVRFSHGCRQ